MRISRCRTSSSLRRRRRLGETESAVDRCGGASRSVGRGRGGVLHGEAPGADAAAAPRLV